MPLQSQLLKKRIRDSADLRQLNVTTPRRSLALHLIELSLSGWSGCFPPGRAIVICKKGHYRQVLGYTRRMEEERIRVAQTERYRALSIPILRSKTRFL